MFIASFLSRSPMQQQKYYQEVQNLHFLFISKILMLQKLTKHPARTRLTVIQRLHSNTVFYYSSL